MTRDEIITTLVLHGWEPFMSGSTILGIKIAAGIWNREERLTITFAPPAQLRWNVLDSDADLVTCAWDDLNDSVIEVFGRVHAQQQVHGVPIRELRDVQRFSGRLIALEQYL